MTQDNKITTEELTKLSKTTGIEEDVIKASGVSDERLKDMFNEHSNWEAFRKKLVAGLALGGAVAPAATVAIGYAFNESAGVQATGPYAVGLQALTLVGMIASVIRFNMKHKGESANPANEIREAADARLVELNKKHGPSM